MQITKKIEIGETITFQTMQEINDFSESYKPHEKEFKCIGISPFVYKKIS